MKKTMPRLSARALAAACVALLLLSLLPLYGIAFYNHASYDDFGFAIRTHAAYRDTGSVLAAVKASAENTAAIRYTWQGTFSTSFFSALQPAIFGESHYWIVTFVLLTGLLLALWLFLRQVLSKALQLEPSSFWTLYALTALTMIQLLPDASEAFYWWNGGNGYTLVWSAMLLRLTLWLSWEKGGCRGGQAAKYVLLLALSVFVGAGNYTTPVLTCLLDGLLLLRAFRGRRPGRWAEAMLFLALLGSLLLSALAPGNWVRAGTLSGGMGPVRAIAQALYFGVALMGNWFSLPLLVLWALGAALLAPRLKRTGYAFAHPLWATAVIVCLFCSQISSTLVTGNYLGDGRVLNTYYYTYVLLSAALGVYWEGWYLHREGEKIQLSSGKGISWAAAALAIALVAVGCAGYRPEGSRNAGPQNLTSVSAARALLSGQAARYDRAMDERDAVMNDPTQPDVTMAVVKEIPPVFMGEALDTPMRDYVLSLYQEYYQKRSVTLSPEEE